MAEYCICNIVYCKLAYPLIATTFSQTQCTKIIKPLLTASLPVAGYVQAFPRAIMYWAINSTRGPISELICRTVHPPYNDPTE